MTKEELRQILDMIPEIINTSDYHYYIQSSIKETIHFYVFPPTVSIFMDYDIKYISIGKIWEKLSKEQQQYLSYHLDIFR